MAIVFINNTSKRLHGIGRALDSKQKGAQVQPTLVNLIPGINKVDADAWEEAKKQKMVGVLVEEGVLKEMAGAEDLRYLNPEEAETMIRQINDRKLLAEWKANDKRKNIQKILKAREDLLDEQEPGTVKPEKVTGGGEGGDGKSSGKK